MHVKGGVVVAVGDSVKDFKVGDIVGVGCMVDSCRSCVNCKSCEEQYCTSGAVFTYNSKAKYPHCGEFDESGGAWTQGGYSQVLILFDGKTYITNDSFFPFVSERRVSS